MVSMAEPPWPLISVCQASGSACCLFHASLLLVLCKKLKQSRLIVLAEGANIFLCKYLLNVYT
jgi:hypothetical protein